eukprot:1514981-Prymnesium_polylepis.1
MWRLSRRKRGGDVRDVKHALSLVCGGAHAERGEGAVSVRDVKHALFDLQCAHAESGEDARPEQRARDDEHVEDERLRVGRRQRIAASAHRGPRGGPMGVTWGSRGGHVGVTWGHMGVTWGPHGGHVGSHGGHVGVAWGSHGVTWGSRVGHVWVTWGSSGGGG